MEFLTRKEVAEQLKISPRKVSDLLASGQIRKHKFGACVRIAPSDLQDYIESAKKGGR